MKIREKINKILIKINDEKSDNYKIISMFKTIYSANNNLDEKIDYFQIYDINNEYIPFKELYLTQESKYSWIDFVKKFTNGIQLNYVKKIFIEKEEINKRLFNTKKNFELIKYYHLHIPDMVEYINKREKNTLHTEIHRALSNNVCYCLLMTLIKEETNDYFNKCLDFIKKNYIKEENNENIDILLELYLEVKKIGEKYLKKGDKYEKYFSSSDSLILNVGENVDYIEIENSIKNELKNNGIQFYKIVFGGELKMSTPDNYYKIKFNKINGFELNTLLKEEYLFRIDQYVDLSVFVDDGVVIILLLDKFVKKNGINCEKKKEKIELLLKDEDENDVINFEYYCNFDIFNYADESIILNNFTPTPVASYTKIEKLLKSEYEKLLKNSFFEVFNETNNKYCSLMSLLNYIKDGSGVKKVQLIQSLLLKYKENYKYLTNFENDFVTYFDYSLVELLK